MSYSNTKLVTPRKKNGKASKIIAGNILINSKINNSSDYNIDTMEYIAQQINSYAKLIPVQIPIELYCFLTTNYRIWYDEIHKNGYWSKDIVLATLYFILRYLNI